MNRLLTTSERFFLNVAEAVIVNIVVLVRFRGQVPVERVRAALDRCQWRHPGLRVRVVADEQPWFSSHRVPPIPLRVVEREGPEHWRSVVEAEQNTPLDIEAGPLIRFTLLRDPEDAETDDCELVCTADHLNADGHSLIALFRDLLDLIDEPDMRLVPLPERTSVEDHLPRGPLDLLALPTPYKNILADRTRALGRRLAARRPSASAARARPHVSFIDRQLDPERSAALIAACREHDATVFNTLMIACAHALGQTRRSHRYSRASLIACTSPINVRDQLDPPVGDDYGLFAWAPVAFHRIAPGADFWALARRANQILSAYRRQTSLTLTRGVRDMLDITEGLGGDPAFATRVVRGLSDGYLIVSNLGRIRMRETVAGAEVHAFDVFGIMPEIDCLMLVNSFRGQLRFVYCCSPSWTGPGIVSRVADGVEAIIDAAIGGPRRGVAGQLEYPPPATAARASS